jgi:FkbM family methyltransferase
MLKRLIRSALSRVIPWVDMHRDIALHIQTDSPILFDVGANIGQTIDAFRYRWPSASILSFEPSPKTFAAIKSSHAARAELYQLAFAERRGTMDFHVTSKHSVNDSLLPMPGDEGHTVQVEARTIDDFCAEHAIDRIDYLKIDTQGYDLNVLKGAAGMLAAKNVRAFSVEITFHQMYEGQPRYHEVLAHADSTGYRLSGFYSPIYLAGKLSSCDALYVHCISKT